MNPAKIKIAYLGGGSRYWARDLLRELALTPALCGVVDLYDLDYPAACRNAAIGEAIFSRAEARTRFKVRAVRRLADALRGADFVVLSIEPGPTEARYADLVIPAKYGILQPVGDTTGPGGIARALRAVPIYTDFALKIERYCPNAWVINYTNPMTLCVAALYAATPKIKAFGCCHEVFHTQKRLAEFVAAWTGISPSPTRHEIEIELTGVNHFTWITRATWQGRDLLPRLRKQIAAPRFFRSRVSEARAAKSAGQWMSHHGLVAFDLFRRFNALAAAGDRHLAEFVPWYATSEENLHRWGVVLTPYSWRLGRAAQRNFDAAYYANLPLQPSDEEGGKLIEALCGFRPIETNVNLPNCGQAPDLPFGHIVETNALFSLDAVTPVHSSSLPPGARALVRRVIDVQQLTLGAAMNRDPELAFQALLADPLNHLSVDSSWKMFKAILNHLRPHLPGWHLPQN